MYQDGRSFKQSGGDYLDRLRSALVLFILFYSSKINTKFFLSKIKNLQI